MAQEKDYIIEEHTPGYQVQWAVERVLHEETTPYQKLKIVELTEFGRALVLDDIVQTTIGDEFIYHEMITHIPLFTHGQAKRVLVIGGGDGGTVREVLKHESVEVVELVEIDERVIAASKEFLPEIASGLEDPRVKILVMDGIKYLAASQAKFDVIIIDSSDPIGPATNLFTREFYQMVRQALKPDGVFVAQTESPFYYQKVFQQISQDIKMVFPNRQLYFAAVPTYVSGLWSFTLGAKSSNELSLNPPEVVGFKTRYYTPELHLAAFAKPQYIKDLIK